MNKMNFVWQYLGRTLLEFKVRLLGYRVYRALMYQDSTDAIVLTELENTLGVKVESFYDNLGSYSLIFDRDLFDGPGLADVVIGNSHMLINGGSNFTIQAYPVFYNELYVESYKTNNLDDNIIGQITDGFGNTVPNVIEVRVYNK